MSKQGLIAKANQLAEDAMRLHPFYRGKIQVLPTCEIRDFNEALILAHAR